MIFRKHGSKVTGKKKPASTELSSFLKITVLLGKKMWISLEKKKVQMVKFCLMSKWNIFPKTFWFTRLNYVLYSGIRESMLWLGWEFLSVFSSKIRMNTLGEEASSHLYSKYHFFKFICRESKQTGLRPGPERLLGPGANHWPSLSPSLKMERATVNRTFSGKGEIRRREKNQMRWYIESLKCKGPSGVGWGVKHSFQGLFYFYSTFKTFILVAIWNNGFTIQVMELKLLGLIIWLKLF